VEKRSKSLFFKVYTTITSPEKWCEPSQHVALILLLNQAKKDRLTTGTHRIITPQSSIFRVSDTVTVHIHRNNFIFTTIYVKPFLSHKSPQPSDLIKSSLHHFRLRLQELYLLKGAWPCSLRTMPSSHFSSHNSPNTTSYRLNKHSIQTLLIILTYQIDSTLLQLSLSHLHHTITDPLTLHNRQTPPPHTTNPLPSSSAHVSIAWRVARESGDTYHAWYIMVWVDLRGIRVDFMSCIGVVFELKGFCSWWEGVKGESILTDYREVQRDCEWGRLIVGVCWCFVFDNSAAESEKKRLGCGVFADHADPMLTFSTKSA